MIWDWAFAAAILPELLKAMRVTIYAAMGGTLIAIFLGLLLAILRRSHVGLISRPTGLFIEFIRSTPLLVQIYFIYYVLPEFGITTSPYLTGVVALGIHYSTYMSEIYRSGIESISRGQWEAALALDLSPARTYRDIIIPQVIPPVLPAIGNYLVAMFKDTPMLSAITVLELLQTAKIIGSDTFRYLEPITIVGVIFLFLSLITAWFVRRIEGRLPQEGIPLR